MNGVRRARMMLASSMLIFGTIGLFRRGISLPSGALAMLRGYIGAAFLALLMLLRRQKPDGAAIRKNLPLLVLSGAGMGFNWILLFEAYNYTSVATATLCYYIAPALVVLMSPPVLRERLTRKRILCVLAALAGMVPVSGVLSGTNGGGTPKGVLFGLAAAVIYAAVVLANKRMSPIPPLDRTVLQLFSAAVVLHIDLLLTGGLDGLHWTPREALLTAAVCVVHTGVAYALYFSSVERLGGQTLALYSYIDPVTAVLLSSLLLHEPMTVGTVIGALLILGGALAGEWNGVRPHRRTGANG